MNTKHLHAPRPNRIAVVDIIAMVTIALGIGLAASVVLGGAVLLFSSGGGDAAVISQAAVLHVASLGRP